jgi:hypothetical protein
MATFTVTGFGTPPITYQWQASNDQGQNWTDMPGEVSNTLTVPDDTFGRFRVVLTNPCGSKISNPVEVVQVPGVSITLQDVSQGQGVDNVETTP